MGKCIGIMAAVNNIFEKPAVEVAIEDWKRIHLKANVNYRSLQFAYSSEGMEWIWLGPVLHIGTLLDESCFEGHFTGAFVGICCQALSGQGLHADFDWFEYVETE